MFCAKIEIMPGESLRVRAKWAVEVVLRQCVCMSVCTGETVWELKGLVQVRLGYGCGVSNVSLRVRKTGVERNK